VPEQYRKGSPVTYVTRGDAPTLILQGTKDPRVPLAQTTRMIDAMTKAGVPGRADLIVGAGHGGWSAAEQERTRRESIAFIEETLTVKPASPAR
jgi:dipeptidyl aminopeptidase/acylaminoacyl peptidase